MILLLLLLFSSSLSHSLSLSLSHTHTLSLTYQGQDVYSIGQDPHSVAENEKKEGEDFRLAFGDDFLPLFVAYISQPELACLHFDVPSRSVVRQLVDAGCTRFDDKGPSNSVLDHASLHVDPTTLSESRCSICVDKQTQTVKTCLGVHPSTKGLSALSCTAASLSLSFLAGLPPSPILASVKARDVCIKIAADQTADMLQMIADDPEGARETLARQLEPWAGESSPTIARQIVAVALFSATDVGIMVARLKAPGGGHGGGSVLAMIARGVQVEPVDGWDVSACIADLRQKGNQLAAAFLDTRKVDARTEPALLFEIAELLCRKNYGRAGGRAGAEALRLMQPDPNLATMMANGQAVGDRLQQAGLIAAEALREQLPDPNLATVMVGGQVVRNRLQQAILANTERRVANLDAFRQKRLKLSPSADHSNGQESESHSLRFVSQGKSAALHDVLSTVYRDCADGSFVSGTGLRLGVINTAPARWQITDGDGVAIADQCQHDGIHAGRFAGTWQVKVGVSRMRKKFTCSEVE